MNETVSGGFTSLFGDTAPIVAPPPQAPATPPPAAPVPPVQAQAPVQQQAQTPPAAPAQTPPVQQEDADFLSLLVPEQQQQAVSWSDEAKKAFQATYGQDDPIAFKQKFDTINAEAEVLRQKAEQGEGATRLLDSIEQRYPALAAALAEAAKGKDPFEYLSSMPNPSVLGKAAKDLPDHFLLQTYKGDRFTPQEINALKTGDYSDLDVSKEDLQIKVKHYLPIAQDVHDERNQKHMASLQQQEQQARQQREAIDKSVTDALSAANNDPAVRRHIDRDFIEKLRKGSVLHGTIFNEDGTWSKSAPAILIKGTRYDADIKRAYEAGLNSAKQRSLIEETARMPERFAPNTGGYASPAPQRTASSNGTFTGIEDFMSNNTVPQQRN